MSIREGDGGSTAPIRSDRFFKVNGEWFFNIREGETLGPFHSKDEAEGALANFLEFIDSANPKMLEDYFRALLNKGKDS